MKPLRYLQAVPLVLCANAVHAEEQSFNFNLPEQALSTALDGLAARTGIKPFYSDQVVAGKTGHAVSGRLTVEQALRQLLSGTGLSFKFNGAEAVAITLPDANSAATLPPVTVVATANVERLDPDNPNYNRAFASASTKTDTPLMDTPMTVEVVPRQVLSDQQAIRLEDAVKNVSGVQPVWTAGGQGQDFVIRGFGTNYSRFRNGQRISSFNADLANIEQVEVLKGPAAMLFGRVQPGGMVNVVTKKPLAEAHYSLQQQFGSYDLYRTVAEATGPLNDDKSLAYRMDFGYTDRRSFRDFVSQTQVFVAPSLHWQASGATEFNLSLEYMDRNLPYDTGIPAVGTRVADVPINTNYGQPGGRFNQDPSDSTLLDFNWSHAFNDRWTFKNGFVANWTTQHYRELLVAVFQPLLEPDNNPLVVRRGSEFEDRTEESYNAYFNLNGKFATGPINHNVLIGGDYFYDEVRQSGFFGFNAVNAPADSPYHFPGDFGGGSFAFTRVNLYNPVYANLDYNAYEFQRINHPNDFSINQTSWYGLYFQDHLAFFDGKLQILGGGRYDWAHQAAGVSTSYQNSADQNDHYNGYVPSFGNVNLAAQSEGFFSPRVGILYRPWNWLSLYGNRVEGFGTNNGRSENGQPLKPETAVQYEAGLKGEWFKGDLTANLAYFHIDKQNVATLVREGVSETIGAARSQGIEMDVAGQLGGGFSLIASYAFTDARITQDSALSGNVGHRLPNVAEHSGSTWLKYAFQNQALSGLHLGIGAYLAGKREGDNANSYQLPGYVRVDTSVGYSLRLGVSKLTTQLNVYNIFDKRYFVAGEPYNANRAWNMPGDPLTVIGSVKLEY